MAHSGVYYFSYFPVSCPKTDAGFELSGARLPQNRRPLLGRKPGSGGSVFPLRRCTTGVRGCPLEGLAGVESYISSRNSRVHATRQQARRECPGHAVMMAPP